MKGAGVPKLPFNLIIREVGCRIYSLSQAQQESWGPAQGPYSPREKGALPFRSLWRSGIIGDSLGSGVAVEGRSEEVHAFAASNATIYTYRYSSIQICN